jgi:outer membrane receptor protein involved in Fe transport
VFTNAAGRPLANSPEFQANATLSYEWPISSAWNMSVAGDMAYKDGTGGVLPGGLVRPPISSYTLLNARLGLNEADGHWSAMVWARNITDQYYWLAAFGSNGTYVRMTGLPATYGVTVSYRY